MTVGEGDAWVFTGGKVIGGHWTRPDVNKPATFTDAGGKPVLLTPGRTWVELAEAGTTNVTLRLTPPSPRVPAAAAAARPSPFDGRSRRTDRGQVGHERVRGAIRSTSGKAEGAA